MKIYEVLDLYEGLQEDQRELVLRHILDLLTEESHYAILEHQLDFDGTIPFKEYIQSQCRLVISCLKAEMTPFGRKVREGQGLQPITRATEIL